MIQHKFKAGDRVRVADKTPYEPMARLMRERQTDKGFVIEAVQHYECSRSTDPYAHPHETVRVQYTDGSLSGAIYGAIFEPVSG